MTDRQTDRQTQHCSISGIRSTNGYNNGKWNMNYYQELTRLTKTRRAGRRVRRNGARRATRPRTRLASVWPVGQDDGPPGFILHVLSRGVINVNYCILH